MLQKPGNKLLFRGKRDLFDIFDSLCSFIVSCYCFPSPSLALSKENIYIKEKHFEVVKELDHSHNVASCTDLNEIFT